MASGDGAASTKLPPAAAAVDAGAILREPLDLVRLCMQEQVYIKMKNNRELTGTLHAFDQHLNMVLSDVTERSVLVEIDPETLEEKTKEKVRKIDMLFARGDGVVIISPKESR